MTRTPGFVERCKRAIEGTTNRVRLSEDRFLALQIGLPSLSEQREITNRIEAIAADVDKVRVLRMEQKTEMYSLLLGQFHMIADNARRVSMKEVAPLVRRPVEVEAEISYAELGIRSFGNGTFHKPTITGLEIVSKRIFRI